MSVTQTPTPEPPKKKDLIPNAEWFCYFVIVFTGYLFATKPTQATGQLMFRLTLLIGAVIGLLVIRFKKKKAGK